MSRAHYLPRPQETRGRRQEAGPGTGEAVYCCFISPGRPRHPMSTSGLAAAETRGSAVQLKRTPSSFIFILTGGDAVTNAAATHSPQPQQQHEVNNINGTVCPEHLSCCSVNHPIVATNIFLQLNVFISGLWLVARRGFAYLVNHPRQPDAPASLHGIRISNIKWWPTHIACFFWFCFLPKKSMIG